MLRADYWCWRPVLNRTPEVCLAIGPICHTACWNTNHYIYNLRNFHPLSTSLIFFLTLSSSFVLYHHQSVSLQSIYSSCRPWHDSMNPIIYSIVELLAEQVFPQIGSSYCQYIITSLDWIKLAVCCLFTTPKKIIYYKHGLGIIDVFTNKITHLFYFAKFKQLN